MSKFLTLYSTSCLVVESNTRSRVRLVETYAPQPWLILDPDSSINRSPNQIPIGRKQMNTSRTLNNRGMGLPSAIGNIRRRPSISSTDEVEYGADYNDERTVGTVCR